MVIYYSERKLLRSLIQCIPLFVFSLFFSLSGFETITGIDTPVGKTGVPLIIGIFSFIFTLIFGYCSFDISKKILSKDPCIVINEEGIIYNASQGGIRFLRWSEIKDFGIYSYKSRHSRQKYIGIELVDNEKILQGVSILERTLQKLDPYLDAPIISIYQNEIDVPLETVYEKMMELSNDAKHMCG